MFHSRLHPQRPRNPLLRELNSAWRELLLDSGSLTDRMKATCSGRFSVRVLAQFNGRASSAEARLLGIRPGRNALIREVQLLCNGTPWVYARSVIPRSTLTGAQRRLAMMGTKPLGAALFADPTMRRDPPVILRLRPGDTLHQHAMRAVPGGSAPIWGRSSRFVLEEKPLLVCEYFLPTWGACPVEALD